MRLLPQVAQWHVGNIRPHLAQYRLALLLCPCLERFKVHAVFLPRQV
jgi:hypothetical protein